MDMKTESQIREAKRAEAMGTLKKSMPDAVTGNSIDYDSYGIPINIPDPGDAMRKAMAEGNEILQTTSVPQPPPRRAPMNRAAMQERGVTQPVAPPQQYEPAPQPAAAQAAAHEFFGQPPQPQQSPVAPPQREPQREAPPQPPYQAVPQHKKPKHPVLQKLLQRFGLKKAERYELDIFSDDDVEKTSYTMTLLPDELNTWALTEAKNKAVLLGDAVVGVYFEHLVVCASVVAIDGVPVWRAFDVKPESWEAEDLVEDALNIPLRIRKVCGSLLADMLWTEVRPLTDKLSDFYQNKILDKRKITSSYDNENDNTARYVCVKDECSTLELLEPQHDVTGMETFFYCKYCASPLVKAAEIKDEGSVPLG